MVANKMLQAVPFMDVVALDQPGRHGQYRRWRTPSALFRLDNVGPLHCSTGFSRCAELPPSQWPDGEDTSDDRDERA
jgi:hypothetical protein